MVNTLDKILGYFNEWMILTGLVGLLGYFTYIKFF